MDTIFEVKIKSLEVAVDRQALRIKLDGNQVFKVSRDGREWKRIRARYVKAHPLCERCLAEGRLTP